MNKLSSKYKDFELKSHRLNGPLEIWEVTVWEDVGSAKNGEKICMELKARLNDQTEFKTKIVNEFWIF